MIKGEAPLPYSQPQPLPLLLLEESSSKGRQLEGHWKVV
jgi:hypothetical protein